MSKLNADKPDFRVCWGCREVKAVDTPKWMGVICMTETVLLVILLVALAEVIKNIKK